MHGPPHKQRIENNCARNYFQFFYFSQRSPYVAPMDVLVIQILQILAYATFCNIFFRKSLVKISQLRQIDQVY